MRLSSPTSWIAYTSLNPAAQLRLFCLPYAGSSAAVYRRWREQLPPFVNVCPIEFPGRGSRMREASHTDLRALAEALAEALRPYLDLPFALFGHSMGAMTAFETARYLFNNHQPQPVHLFISACRAPQFFGDTRVFYNLPELEFIEELRRLNGTPPEVLAHPELIQIIVPILRADFQACQTYKYQPGPPLGCPLTVFSGLQDESLNYEHLAGWQEHSAHPLTLCQLPGDHFFLHKYESMLLAILSEECAAIVRRMA